MRGDHRVSYEAHAAIARDPVASNLGDYHHRINVGKEEPTSQLWAGSGDALALAALIPAPAMVIAAASTAAILVVILPVMIPPAVM